MFLKQREYHLALFATIRKYPRSFKKRCGNGLIY